LKNSFERAFEEGKRNIVYMPNKEIHLVHREVLDEGGEHDKQVGIA